MDKVAPWSKSRPTTLLLKSFLMVHVVHKIKHYTTHRLKIRLTPITCWAFLHISEALVRCCSRLSQHHVSSTWRMYFCKTRLWFILFSSRFSFSFLVTLLFLAGNLERIKADECHLTPVIHKLQYPGCQEKRIPSYACVGRCTSYVKVRVRGNAVSTVNNILTHFRCLDPRFGKRRDHACAVRKAENVWPWCHWTVQMLVLISLKPAK